MTHQDQSLVKELNHYRPGLLARFGHSLKSYILGDNAEQEWAELAWMEAGVELRARRGQGRRPLPYGGSSHFRLWSKKRRAIDHDPIELNRIMV